MRLMARKTCDCLLNGARICYADITHRLISLYLALESSSTVSSSNGSSSNGAFAGAPEWMARHAGLIAIAQVRNTIEMFNRLN
jgi:hypothetical protein